MAAILQTHPVRSTRGIVLHGGEAFASTIPDSATSRQRRSRVLCSIWGGNNGRTDPCAEIDDLRSGDDTAMRGTCLNIERNA